MKKILKEWLGPGLWASWVLWPWVLGSIDLMVWVLTGSQVSTIAWESEVRVIAVAVWPVAWMVISLFFVGTLYST